MSDNKKILTALGAGEVLAQLAEECAELAQAALKYRRVITGHNPTPVTPEEALENLHEEIADVDLCLVVLSELCESNDKELSRMEAKRTRWVKQIEEAKGGPT